MPTTTIALDGNEANTSQHVGSNVYALELLRAMEAHTRNNPDITCTVLLSQPARSCLPARRKGWRYQVIGPQTLWTQWALPIHLYKNHHRYDVFFTPGHYAPRVSWVPYVSSVMDTAYLVFPDQFKTSDLIKLKSWTQYSVKKAKKIIVISKHTQQEVVAYYHRSIKDVIIAYPGCPTNLIALDLDQTKKILTSMKIGNNFILYVGTLQPRKNLIRLIDAFELCMQMYLAHQTKKASQKIDVPQLVLAGKVGWLADEITHRIRTSPHSKQIITTGYIDEKTKTALYQQAKSLVLVGLYEGFGMPPLEAMTHGCVPIVATTSSLPEVVGDAGILVDPLNTTQISEALLRSLTMSKLERAQFRKKAREQIGLFSWEDSAKTVINTLVEVAHSKL